MRQQQARARETSVAGLHHAGEARDPYPQLDRVAQAAPATAQLARLAGMARGAPATVQLAKMATMAADRAPIQRQIADDEWEQLEDGTSQDVHSEITVTKLNGEIANYTIRHMPKTPSKPARMQIEVESDKWLTLTPEHIQKMKAQGVWDGSFKNVHEGKDTPEAEFINNDRTAPATNIIGTETGTLEMDVQSNKHNDRLALVHRSLSLYDGGGQNMQGREHLTLENEHMLAMLAQQRDKSSVYYAQQIQEGSLTKVPKVYDKPAVNDALRDNFQVREIDNLNFYLTAGHGCSGAPMETPKPARATLPAYDPAKHDSPKHPPPDEQLSLRDYLTFLARALKSTKDKSEAEITPSVYGVKYEKLLEGMQVQMGIDPSQAFLDSSDVGHRKKFIQAVLVMHARGIVKELQDEDKWKEQYKKYHQRPPVLRREEGDNRWTEIKSGEADYNDLDREYADRFYKDILRAVLDYRG